MHINEVIIRSALTISNVLYDSVQDVLCDFVRGVLSNSYKNILYELTTRE